MRVFLALLIGIIAGAAAVWFYSTERGKSAVRQTGDQIENSTKAARDSIQDKIKSWDLSPEKIRDELARSGQVVRRKAQEAGQVIADKTADARVTAAIKGKLVTDRDLSAMSISVNTTDGVVTLSGTASSADNIGKAIRLAMETDGVREVISTIQVKAAGK